MGGVDEAIECGDAGGEKMFGRLHAALLVREERTFKVDAEGACASGLGQFRDFVGKPVKRAQGGVKWCGDGGGEVGAGSARCEKRAHGVERLRGRFHHVVAGCTVDMNVEKCRAKCGAGKIEHVCARRQLGCFAAGYRVDFSVFNKDERMLVQAGSVPEPLCGHYRLHGYPLLQVNARACSGCRALDGAAVVMAV